MAEGFAELATMLVEIGRGFYGRGWCLGTSGNFSAVVARDPLTLAMSASGIDKGSLSAKQILLMDGRGRVIGDQQKPSDESQLHLRLADEFGAGAVLHTHSVWSTTLSDLHYADGGLSIEGYEMLKGLAGVKTHQHREWLPIIENSQDMLALSDTVAQMLKRNPGAHGFLLRGHGLYAWGHDLGEAKRHIEIFEFLLEAIGRTRLMSHGPGGV